jgi:hypothetical protein
VACAAGKGTTLVVVESPSKARQRSAVSANARRHT